MRAVFSFYALCLPLTTTNKKRPTKVGHCCGRSAARSDRTDSVGLYTIFSPSTIYILFPYSFRILVPNKQGLSNMPSKNTAPNRAYILKYSLYSRGKSLKIENRFEKDYTIGRITYKGKNQAAAQRSEKWRKEYLRPIAGPFWAKQDQPTYLCGNSPARWTDRLSRGPVPCGIDLFKVLTLKTA